jgi:uncharacterized circularly permuted ATP-grasp superfamily protein
VLLTPGSLNSAYYEHSFLADLMGIELVEPQDLFVENGLCWMRTTRGPQRVDVIYRRIDDTYIDPLTFKADSLLGVPGLFNVYRSGGVTLCSAPGAGVADDKAIYVFVPDMIKFYLGEKPILENVQTWRCAAPDDLKYVLDNLKDLVIKRVHGSGGYGMLIGPHAARRRRSKPSAPRSRRTRASSSPSRRSISRPRRSLARPASRIAMSTSVPTASSARKSA